METDPKNQSAIAEAPASAPAEKASKITLDQLINACIDKEASDIHFGEGRRVALRVGGKIVFVENIESLSKEDADAMVFQMLTTEDEKKRLDRVRELDFSYIHTNGVSFRVNAFYQRGRLSVVMRMISKNIPSMDELGIPQQIKKFLDLKEGLILVSGPTGSGKSTTVQAMIDYINTNSVSHILTIENPIEYVFEDKKSIISQREIGKDTLTMTNALQSAIREDPNIIMVSEIKDMEALNNVLTLVETGHLVISSTLTKDTRQTIEKMVGFYPESQQQQARNQIADNLTAILAQDLLDRKDQAGLVAVYELMIMNQSIRNIIKRGNFTQLRTAIQSGGVQGMITMDQYAAQLVEQGIVSLESASRFTEEE